MLRRFFFPVLAIILAVSYWPSATQARQLTATATRPVTFTQGRQLTATPTRPVITKNRSYKASSNHSYSSISNIMKTKHDTVKNAISNVR